MDVHNRTIVCDINHLNETEIKEEYKRLTHIYNTLKAKNEIDLQKIHELKRNLQTTTAAESYLSTELELVTSTHATEINTLNSKWQESVEDLKIQNINLRQSNYSLDTECETLRKELNDLKMKNASIENKTQDRNVDSPKLIGPSEIEIQLEKEINQLSDLNTELQKNCNQHTEHMQMLETQLNDTREKVSCLEDTLQSKREDLEEKNVCIETLHSQLIELNAELALLKNVPEDNNRKGNSLFAEVDDQRQKMKSLLAAQKKHYLQMKLAYNESEKTISQLKRKNAAVCKEIEKCTTIFLNANKLHEQKLHEQISGKIREIELLEKKLKWTENELFNAVNGNGTKVVDSLFSFCKRETDDYKKQMQFYSVQKVLIEDNFINSQEELAKWRLEAIKLRLIIAQMETFLDDNGIKYSKAKKIDVSDKELRDAKPNILVEIKLDANKIDYKTSIKKDIFDQNDLNNKEIIPVKNDDGNVKENSFSVKDVNLVTIEKLFETEENTVDVDVMNDDELAAFIDKLCVTKAECVVTNKILNENTKETKIIGNIENENSEVSISNNSNEMSPEKEQITNDIEEMNDDELAAIIDRICGQDNKNASDNKENDNLLQLEMEKYESLLTSQSIDSSKLTRINKNQEDNKKHEQQLEGCNDDSVHLLSKYRDISLNSHLTEKKKKSQQKIEQRITKYMNGSKLNKISPPPTSTLSRHKDALPILLKEKKTGNFSDKLEASTSDKSEEKLKETDDTKKVVVRRRFIPSIKRQ